MLYNIWRKIVYIFSVKELRDRVFFTLIAILVARIGVYIYLPGIDVTKFMGYSGIMSIYRLLGSGGKFPNIFSLGVTPYVNASIFMSFSHMFWKRIEEMRKEGGKMQEKLNLWTMYLALILSFFHSINMAINFYNMKLVFNVNFWYFVGVVCSLMCGSMFSVWLGHQITKKGVGNGISIIIFINIISGWPVSFINFFQFAKTTSFFYSILLLSFFCVSFLIFAIVVYHLAFVKIEILYTGGRGDFSATKSFLPIKLDMSSIMPVIFASAILYMSRSAIDWIVNYFHFSSSIISLFDINGPLMIFIQFCLVVIFNFSYSSVVFNPEKVAFDLRRSGGSITNIRAGSESKLYLADVLFYVTVFSSFFLGILAVLPNLFFYFFQNTNFYFSGTSLLIVVSIVVELLQKIDSSISFGEYKALF